MTFRRLTANDKCSHCGEPCDGRELALPGQKIIYCARHAYIINAAVSALWPIEAITDAEKIAGVISNAVRSIASAVHPAGVAPLLAGQRAYFADQLEPALKALRAVKGPMSAAVAGRLHHERARSGRRSNRTDAVTPQILEAAAIYHLRLPSESAFTLREVCDLLHFAAKKDPNRRLFGDWKGSDDNPDLITERHKVKWSAARKSAMALMKKQRRQRVG